MEPISLCMSIGKDKVKIKIKITKVTQIFLILLSSLRFLTMNVAKSVKINPRNASLEATPDVKTAINN